MLPIIIGKSGSKIKELQKATDVTIDVDRDANLVKLCGNEVDSVLKAKALLTEQIEAIRKENAEFDVPTEVVSSLIGKKGANLTRIREETGANIDVTSDGKGTVRVRGSEEAVGKARTAIESFVTEWLKTNVVKEIPVHADQIRLIVGVKGGTIKLITEESGAKLDLDRDRNVVVIRGSAEAVEGAAILVNRIVDEDNAANATARAEAAATKLAATREATPFDKDNAKGSPTTQAIRSGGGGTAADSGAPAINHHNAEWNFPKVPPGADATMAKQLMDKASKKKKKDKKEQKQTSRAVTPDVQPTSETANGGEAITAAEKGTNGHAPRSEKVVVDDGHKSTNTEAKAAAGGGGGGEKKKKNVEDVVAAARDVVKTEKANELLGLILGGESSAAGESTSASSTGGGGERGSSSTNKYFKSTSGFSIRL